MSKHKSTLFYNRNCKHIYKYIVIAIMLLFVMILAKFIGADFTEVFGIGMIILIYGFYISVLICRNTKSKILKVLSWIYRIVVILFVVFFIIIESFIWKDIITTGSTQTNDARYIIVLGAGLKGDNMGQVLESRCQKGLEYLKNNKNTDVICSGGQGVNEVVPESVPMAKYYREHGIPDNRILLDEKSKTTIQNLEYSKDILEKYNAQNDRIIIVTSSFNILRAKMIAKKLNLNAQYLGSNSKFRFNVNYSIREFGAIIYNFIELNI